MRQPFLPNGFLDTGMARYAGAGNPSVTVLFHLVVSAPCGF